MNDITDKIAAALAATDTAARALWEAMGAPGDYRHAMTDAGPSREVTAFFRTAGHSCHVEHRGCAVSAVARRHGDGLIEFKHHGTLDSCRAALAAYLGAA